MSGAERYTLPPTPPPAPKTPIAGPTALFLIKAAIIGFLLGLWPSEYLKTHPPVPEGWLLRNLYGSEEGYAVCVRWHLCKKLKHHNAPGVLDNWKSGLA